VNKGEIWLARLYFLDNPQKSKRRPVVVLDVQGQIVKVAKITSHPPRDESGEVVIVEGCLPRSKM
jgi:hypothetical protein